MLEHVCKVGLGSSTLARVRRRRILLLRLRLLSSLLLLLGSLLLSRLRHLLLRILLAIVVKRLLRLRLLLLGRCLRLLRWSHQAGAGTRSRVCGLVRPSAARVLLLRVRRLLLWWLRLATRWVALVQSLTLHARLVSTWSLLLLCRSCCILLLLLHLLLSGQVVGRKDVLGQFEGVLLRRLWDRWVARLMGWLRSSARLTTAWDLLLLLHGENRLLVLILNRGLSGRSLLRHGLALRRLSSRSLRL